jgi:redox-sensitive bicupin YhaK (pirin superfamily)
MQIWLTPESAGLTPGYEQKQFTAEERTGKLLPIVAGQDTPGTLKIHQDTTFYVARLNGGQAVAHTFKPNRRAFLYVIEGEVSANDETLSAGDQARLVNPEGLRLQALQDSEVILIDLP